MKKSIVMMGATGAVGGQSLATLLQLAQFRKLTLLGRRPVANITAQQVQQHNIDVANPTSYASFLGGHQAAICTLGVGQPSKVSREDFLKIDHQAPLDFAKACKKAGIQHFSLLSSVGISSKSSSFFLRSKGELVDEIQALNFNRFSVFQPSMILTPQNRYGVLQGITLKIWPWLHPLLVGGMRKYRGIKVELLGQAIAKNIFVDKNGMEYVQWDEINSLTQASLEGW